MAYRRTRRGTRLDDVTHRVTSDLSLGSSPPRKASRRARGRRALPGLALAAGVAVVASVLGTHFRLIGAPVIAIVSGIVIALVLPRRDAFHPGLSVAAKSVLKGSIIVLGTGLSFGEVLGAGTSSLPVLIGTLVVALLGAWLVGKWLKIPTDLTTLIGIGTAICGASAIAATDAVIDAPEADVSYAIATIFTFNVAAVLTFPTVGHLLHFSQHAFGLWSGTAINDMSSVVAASSIYGKSALAFGVIVKLTRTLFIIPIVLVLSSLRATSSANSRGSTGLMRHVHTVRRAFPLFIAWFLVAVLLNTVKLIPAGWHASLSTIAAFMITMAMAGIGLSTNVRDIRRAGARPLALGAVLWVLVASSSLLLQNLTGH